MTEETEEERGLRHQIADVDEDIRKKSQEIALLYNRKVDLKNQLFTSRYNRGVRNE